VRVSAAAIACSGRVPGARIHGCEEASDLVGS
jgi:hypothetical protein